MMSPEKTRIEPYSVERNGVTDLRLVVDDEGAAAHDVTTVPHLSLPGADLLGFLHLWRTI